MVGIVNKPGVSPIGCKFKSCKDSAVIGFHNNCIMHITYGIYILLCIIVRTMSLL